jgi:hypothetical protein
MMREITAPPLPPQASAVERIICRAGALLFMIHFLLLCLLISTRARFAK